jgi:3-oxoacyl-[acyl-carrier protein] reductase
MKLQDKVALVTGGSSGIGREICLAFAGEGARIGVIASSDKLKAQTVVDQITEIGGEALAIVADVTEAEDLRAAVDSVTAAYGGLDILVNSAGVHYQTRMGTCDPADIDRIIDINLKGALHAINAAVPALEARGGGKIISMSSMMGFIGMPDNATYCATKAGIAHMTKALARELAPKGINVNAIAPGFTATPMNEVMRTKPEFKELLDYFASITPGRLHSMPEEIAVMAVFLASDDALPMHGSTVMMDEGVSTGVSWPKAAADQ